MCDGLAQARIKQQGSGKLCDVTVLHSPRDSDDFSGAELRPVHFQRQDHTYASRDVVHAGRSAPWNRLQRTASSAAADLTWRARAPEEATRRGLLPRLLSVVLRGSGGNRRHHRRRRSLFYRRCGAGRAGQGVVFLEAALFVFAARTAWAGLVAPRSSNRPSSHRTSVHPCYGSRSAASGFMRPAVRAGR